MAVPVRVYPDMLALDPACAFPFSRPMPMPDAWEGMTMACAGARRGGGGAAVRPTRAARRVADSSLAARTVKAALALVALGALATTRAGATAADWVRANMVEGMVCLRGIRADRRVIAGTGKSARRDVGRTRRTRRVRGDSDRDASRRAGTGWRVAPTPRAARIRLRRSPRVLDRRSSLRRAADSRRAEIRIRARRAGIRCDDAETETRAPDGEG